MSKGKIARLTDKGFGFIKPEGEGEDLFFHASDVLEDGGFDSLKEGDEVDFEHSSSEKGPKASNVKKA